MVLDMKTIDNLRKDILETYARIGNWRAVGTSFAIPARTAWRIATSDYEPKRPDIRFHLGLPTLIPAPACVKCGQVHISRRCPNGKKSPSNWRDGEAWFKRLIDWLK
jgi:hypothetical protein